jgi:hypothetical protein
VEGLLDILWHPYFTDPEFGSDRAAAASTLISWVSSLAGGAWIATLDEVARWWDGRRGFAICGGGREGGRIGLQFRASEAVGEVGLIPVPRSSDIRIEASSGCDARIEIDEESSRVITGSMGAGSELTLSLVPREKRGV